MSLHPWECPRCQRMNAPMTPYCQCTPNRIEKNKIDDAHLHWPNSAKYQKEVSASSCLKSPYTEQACEICGEIKAPSTVHFCSPSHHFK
jgi:hypothetical protein